MAIVAFDNTTSQADVQWSSLGPKVTPLMALSGLEGSVLTRGFIGLAKSNL